ncbi:hypothetical protein WICPIJ_009927 [Wickerhamomyces pijperi]|uniref:Small ribosomal subunit protein mS38 n=1 Tax=Wickerhamomyces pijperi TaxID=599730 RepID=A0A9P8TCB0_WICPI|nr:hypothetical protein WICPIJ_009927 [Wickerhamomyces pijperi]
MFSLIRPQVRGLLTRPSLSIARTFTQLKSESSLRTEKLLPLIPTDTLSKLFQIQLNLNSGKIMATDPLLDIPEIANFHSITQTETKGRKTMNDPLGELTAMIDELDADIMHADSVLRKRKLKMKKHKLRKRRKAQRALRRKLKKD